MLNVGEKSLKFTLSSEWVVDFAQILMNLMHGHGKKLKKFWRP